MLGEKIGNRFYEFPQDLCLSFFFHVWRYESWPASRRSHQLCQRRIVVAQSAKGGREPDVACGGHQSSGRRRLIVIVAELQFVP